MGAELKDTELEIKRTDTYALDDKAAVHPFRFTMGPTLTFLPTSARVCLSRYAEHKPYQFTTAYINGPVIKVNGKPGKRTGYDSYSQQDIDKAPLWLRDLITESVARAERDRLGEPNTKEEKR